MIRRSDLAFARGKANSDMLVASPRDRIVASAMVGHDGHRGTMYYVSVDPDRQGRGFGRQIVAAAEAWLKARGVWKINLLVRQGNEAVLGFYDGLGYDDGTSVQIEKWIDPSKRGDSLSACYHTPLRHAGPAVAPQRGVEPLARGQLDALRAQACAASASSTAADHQRQGPAICRCW